MVSLKDISQECGVSIATVSKALNDKDDISEKTKLRVLESARRMGYLPNLAAKTLKTRRTYNLGVLFVDEAMSGLTHDYFSYVLDSFKRTAEQKGFDITFINCCKKRKNRMTYLEDSRYRGFEGVVIACIDFDDPDVKDLVESGIPVVTIDHAFENHISVVSDNRNGMKDLLEYIYRKGHRRIAYIHGADSSVTKNRISSFFETAEKLGLNLPDSYIQEAPYRDTETAYEKTEILLALSNPPTCILYPDDFAALGGMRAIRHAGLKIPDDISIAGYDGTRTIEYMEPQLTTLKQDTVRIGQTAAEQLIGLIEGTRSGAGRQYLITGSLLEGCTVRDLNQSE